MGRARGPLVKPWHNGITSLSLWVSWHGKPCLWNYMFFHFLQLTQYLVFLLPPLLAMCFFYQMVAQNAADLKNVIVLL